MDQGFDLNRKKRSYDSHFAPSSSIQIILGTLRPRAITCKPDGSKDTPGNAILQNGVVLHANPEIGVPRFI
jgi:hypothetical protein